MQKQTTNAQPRILIAYYDCHTRQLFVDQLEQAGYSVMTASNGAEALEYLRQFSVDVLIVDLFIDDMFGDALIAHVRHEALILLRRIIIMLDLAEDGSSSSVMEIEGISFRAWEQPGYAKPPPVNFDGTQSNVMLFKPCDPRLIVRAVERTLQLPL